MLGSVLRSVPSPRVPLPLRGGRYLLTYLRDPIDTTAHAIAEWRRRLVATTVRVRGPRLDRLVHTSDLAARDHARRV
jgi:hypothetical protein